MDIQEKLKNWVKEILNIEGDFVLVHPKDVKNGDYTFISSLENPQEDLEKLKNNKLEEIEKIERAGRFINFYLSRKFFARSVEEILNNKSLGENGQHAGKKVMIEYTDPNPFKPFHIGHLMTNAIGESISRILEVSGAQVSRANYQGDVGLHVAKALWALQKYPELQDKNIPIAEQSANIGRAYAQGSQAYEESPEAKNEIDAINKKIYDKSDNDINEVYQWGFKATMEAFEDLYKMLGTKFDFYFLESQVAEKGKKLVEDNKGKAADPDNRRIFEESDGAIVFKAENHDPKLHTRVFITSQGLPTYETKELGLTEEKFKVLPGMDLSIVVTANEQADYMKVVAKALSLMHPEYGNKMKHITHGMMRFVDGKMSSRKGNVVTGEDLLKQTKILVTEKMADRDFEDKEREEVSSQVAVSAIKYSILKQSTGGDIVYDFEKSISFEGDSGPYMQYSYARAYSVLDKAQKENISPDPHAFPEEAFEIEKLLYRFPEVVYRAGQEFEPHYIANYLVELARAYNSFYGNNVIVKADDKSSAYKIAMTYAFSFIMKKGLHLLGIETPSKM